MKKFLLLTTTASILASSAFAKTEGNYFGIDVLRTSAQEKSSSSEAADHSTFLSNYYSHDKKDSAVGFGLNYKHAFNFNNFFIAPGIFFERLGLDSKVGYSTTATDAYSQSINLKNRYGIRADLGYDLTDKFSAYVPVGYNVVSYQISTYDQGGLSYITSKKIGSEGSYFYGLGLSYAITDNFGINAEYNRLSQMKLKSASGVTIDNSGTIIANTTVQIFKIGTSYKF